MGEYLVYHNPDRMGYPAEEVDTLSIVTSRSTTGVVDSRIRLVTGNGTPRTYYLCGWFLAKEVRENDDEEFRHVVEGTVGEMLRERRWPILNHESWFKAFQHEQGNFAFGLNPISQPEVIAGFEKLIARLKTSSRLDV